MQVTAKPDEVYLLENETQNAAKKVIAGKVRELARRAAQPELDIRGMAVDEALPVLDNFLDDGHAWAICRTSASSTARAPACCARPCRRNCAAASTSSRFRLGVYGEGEAGVTIVEFK